MRCERWQHGQLSRARRGVAKTRIFCGSRRSPSVSTMSLMVKLELRWKVSAGGTQKSRALYRRPLTSAMRRLACWRSKRHSTSARPHKFARSSSETNVLISAVFHVLLTLSTLHQPNPCLRWFGPFQARTKRLVLLRRDGRYGTGF